MKTKLLLVLWLATIGITVNAQQVVVNDLADPETNFTPEELIENVLLSGGANCVDVNVTYVGQNPAGATNLSQRSWGYFRNDGEDFPFEEGIVLSSGYAVNAGGPNSSTASSDGTTAWQGDIDLTTLLNNEYSDSPTASTNNATVFEFEFTSTLDQISFDFIFASEEYEDSFECSPNLRDGFAFLISGPGIDEESGTPFGGQNIATVPYSDGVLVNTGSIHAGYEGTTVPCSNTVQNVDYFPLYYVSNSNTTIGGGNNVNDIEFDGRTISLTARANIIPGETYLMKMVIADRGDALYDSAVFLRAGSFDIGNANLGSNITLSSGNANCEGDAIYLSSGNTVEGAEHVWYKDGDVIEGATEETIAVTTTGQYTVEVYFSDTCFVTDDVLIEFFPVPDVDLGPSIFLCQDEPVTLDATPSNVSDFTNLTYTWYRNGVEQAETTGLLNINDGGNYSVVVTSDNSCVGTAEVDVVLVNFNVDLGDPISPCGNDEYEIVPVVNGADSANATYQWSTGEQTPTITVSENGNYWVDVTINGCTERGTANVIFREKPLINIGGDFSKCINDVVQLDASIVNNIAGVTYTWYLNDMNNQISTSPIIDVTDEGTYIVEVDNNGCSVVEQVTVQNYTVDNCVVPQGISPNGDNLNDCMDLEFLNDELGIQNVKIFNRHGRMVFERNNYINEFCGTDDNGNELPTGTYYYVISLNASNAIYDQIETGWIYINREN